MKLLILVLMTFTTMSFANDSFVQVSKVEFRKALKANAKNINKVIIGDTWLESSSQGWSETNQIIKEMNTGYYYLSTKEGEPDRIYFELKKDLVSSMGDLSDIKFIEQNTENKSIFRLITNQFVVATLDLGAPSYRMRLNAVFPRTNGFQEIEPIGQEEVVLPETAEICTMIPVLEDLTSRITSRICQTISVESFFKY